MAENLFELGLQAFQQKDYYQAHEEWEELWSDPGLSDRHIVQGFIQVAVSLFHAHQENLVGARSMIEKALLKWRQVPADWHNIDMKRLVQDTRRWAEHLRQIRHIKEVDFSLSPEVKRR